jgi:VIT1/CCC1 family predicted Fe2+/Mn2+ transporter
VSTAALLVGLVAAGATRNALLTAGAAALTAGSLAMAIGEYVSVSAVSVSAQADTEKADRNREKIELDTQPDQELKELVQIYQHRGLPPELARSVSEILHQQDALQAHLRDELGHAEHSMARPLQAASVSAASFGAGAALPLLAAAVSPDWGPKCRIANRHAT